MAANVAGSSSKPKVFPMRVKGEHVLLAIKILLAEVSSSRFEYWHIPQTTYSQVIMVYSANNVLTGDTHMISDAMSATASTRNLQHRATITHMRSAGVSFFHIVCCPFTALRNGTELIAKVTAPETHVIVIQQKIEYMTDDWANS